MRQMETRAKAKLVVAVLMLAAARVHAQETAGAQRVERQIVVSLSDRKLALIENGQVTKTYPVAVGKASTPSPAGTFKIVNRVTDPTYYHQGQVIEPGPDNPVGTRWIGLDRKGYGIHGTNAPRSIGKAASHGCIRMAKADLEELFEILRPGDVVEIHAGEDEVTARVFGTQLVVASAAGSVSMAAR
jgi:lipoprotein-anchoring transpeptidase ErfK/SrfK